MILKIKTFLGYENIPIEYIKELPYRPDTNTYIVGEGNLLMSYGSKELIPLKLDYLIDDIELFWYLILDSTFSLYYNSKKLIKPIWLIDNIYNLYFSFNKNKNKMLISLYEDKQVNSITNIPFKEFFTKLVFIISKEFEEDTKISDSISKIKENKDLYNICFSKLNYNLIFNSEFNELDIYQNETDKFDNDYKEKLINIILEDGRSVAIGISFSYKLIKFISEDFSINSLISFFSDNIFTSVYRNKPIMFSFSINTKENIYYLNLKSYIKIVKSDCSLDIKEFFTVILSSGEYFMNKIINIAPQQYKEYEKYLNTIFALNFF